MATQPHVKVGVGEQHEPPTDPPGPLRSTQAAQSRKRRHARLRTFLCRLDVSWSLLFLVFLLCVGITTTSVTHSLITRCVYDSWRSVHGARVAAMTQRLSVGLDRVHDIATATASLHLQKPARIEEESVYSVLCTALDEYDKKTRFRALLVLSRVRAEAAGCMHGLSSTGSLRTLTAFVSRNHTVNGSYLVNSDTHAFVQPLQQVSPWMPSRQNLSVTTADAYDSDPLFPAAEAYYAGVINDTDLSLRWTYRSATPHLIFYSLPLGFITRGMPRAARVPPTDFLQVRLDGSLLFDNYDFLKAPGYSVMAFMNFSLTDTDPLVLSNNWGQPSASNTSLYTPSVTADLSYLHASNVSDPLMREALKHVHLSRLQRAGYEETVEFFYHGALAVVTAHAFRSSQGLTIPLVFASAQASFTGPYRTIFHICDVVVGVAVVLFTALLWWFVHTKISRPLEEMTAHLESSLKPGSRALICSGAGACGVQLTEVGELVRVYNDTMRQLREVDAYLPEALREPHRDDEPSRGIFCHTTGFTSRTSLPRSLSQGSSCPPTTGLREMEMSVVHIRIRPCRTATTTTDNVPLIELVETSQRPLRRGERLAAAVTSAAQMGCIVNTGPFPSRRALSAFVAAVHELSTAHHGVVHALTPDSCTVHFHKAVRTYHVRCTARRARSPGGTSRASAAAAASPSQKQRRRRVSLQHLIAWDAHAAVAFALALQQWVTKAATRGGPDVRVVVDTNTFVCGQHRAVRSEQTMSVAFGRDVMREIGYVPEKIGVKVAMTEETAVRVRDGLAGARRPGVRQIPVEALCTGREGLDGDVVILYEALPGLTTGDGAWHSYAGCVFDAFALMLRGDYAAAHRALSGIGDISNLEPGLMPSILRREAAASEVTGGAVSTQAGRLMRECTSRVARRVTSGFYRRRHVPLGIDAVLKGDALPQSSAPTTSQAVQGLASTTSPRRRSPRRGVRAPVEVALCKSKERFIVTVNVDGQPVRHVIADPPRWAKDNYGMHWYLPLPPGKLSYADYHKLKMTALGSAGLLSTVTAYLLRDVPPLVAKVIENAPDGTMSDALRSAVPVCEPPAKVRAQLLHMFYDHRKLAHPNILLPIAYTYAMEGGVSMIGEYCPGGSLRDIIARYDRIHPLTAFRFGACVTAGLAYLHSKGCVHGALSPETVMVGADGTCKLTGYFTDYARASAIFVLRHTYCVSPAMAAGQPPTPACDMFCCGLLTLEVLTRHHPWAWAAAATVAEDGEEGASVPSEAELSALVNRGGSAFCAAVANGRVVPHLALLDEAVVTEHYTEGALGTVRSCLLYDPAARPTAAQASEVVRKLIELQGAPS